jgi:MFS superfamily sulfate permease-like transporter
VANLILATAMSGVLLFAMGLLKLGNLIRFIPVAVVIGFTNGIAVLVALSQIKDFLGLSVPNMPADFGGILQTLGQHVGDFNPWALGLASAGVLVLLGWQAGGRRMAHSPSPWVRGVASMPSSIVVLVLATAITAWWGWNVETIGSRFGGILFPFTFTCTVEKMINPHFGSKFPSVGGSCNINDRIFWIRGEISQRPLLKEIFGIDKRWRFRLLRD